MATTDINPVNIVCLKWGSKYPAEYVNRLYRMVKSNLSRPFNFYCLTDFDNGYDDGVISLPLEVEPGLKGWWYKLQLFKSEFYGITGDILFFDLDVVVTAQIDELFAYAPGQFTIIKDLQEGKVYNSSVFRLTVGSQTHVWDRFLADKEQIMARMHGDQDWISECVTDATLWPDEWVVSFKKQCNARNKRSYGKVGEMLRKIDLLQPQGEAVVPDNAKLVYFHGKPDPDDVADSPYGMWKKASWIRKAWSQES